MTFSRKTRDELAHDAATTQQELQRLWAELKGKVAPADVAQLMAERAEAARATATAHPLATAVFGAGIGAGLAWLFLGQTERKQSAAEAQARDTAEQLRDKASAAAARASQLRDDAQAELAELAAAAKTRLRSMIGGNDSLLDQGQGLARQIPLGAAALVIAAGAGLSLLFPRGRAVASAALDKATPSAVVPPVMAALSAEILRALQAFNTSAPQRPVASAPKVKKAVKSAAKKAVKSVVKSTEKTAEKAAAKVATKTAETLRNAETLPKSPAEANEKAPRANTGAAAAQGSGTAQG